MSEAIVHPIPSETTIVEDATSLAGSIKRYFHRNGDAFLAMALTMGAIAVNRSILRHELKRLNFNVEIYPDDEWGDYGNARFDED